MHMARFFSDPRVGQTICLRPQWICGLSTGLPRKASTDGPKKQKQKKEVDGNTRADLPQRLPEQLGKMWPDMPVAKQVCFEVAIVEM